MTDVRSPVPRRLCTLGWPWPVAALALSAMTACDAAPIRHPLQVFAASSLTDAFGAMEPQVEAQHPAVDVELVFGGSQMLRRQIEAGANPSVFASADARTGDEEFVIEKASGLNGLGFERFGRCASVFASDHIGQVVFLHIDCPKAFHLDGARPFQRRHTRLITREVSWILDNADSWITASDREGCPEQGPSNGDVWKRLGYHWAGSSISQFTPSSGPASSKLATCQELHLERPSFSRLNSNE